MSRAQIILIVPFCKWGRWGIILLSIYVKSAAKHWNLRHLVTPWHLFHTRRLLLYWKWHSLVAQTIRNPPAIWKTRVGKISWRRAWQPTLVFLPGEFPWTEEPAVLQAGVTKSRAQLSDKAHTSHSKENLVCIWSTLFTPTNGFPILCSILSNREVGIRS